MRSFIIMLMPLLLCQCARSPDEVDRDILNRAVRAKVKSDLKAWHEKIKNNNMDTSENNNAIAKRRME